MIILLLLSSKMFYLNYLFFIAIKPLILVNKTNIYKPAKNIVLIMYLSIILLIVTYFQIAKDNVNYVLSWVVYGVAKISMNMGLMCT